jgi:stalled ribosome rescue protein Dom34
MKTNKKVGIFMDHSSAHFIQFPIEESNNHLLHSAFNNNSKQESADKSEHLMHNKEQHQQNEYYEKIGEEIRKYDNVLLFGPTNAKSELYNILKKNHLFNDIKITLQQTDKLTAHQKIACVKDFFINQL